MTHSSSILLNICSDYYIFVYVVKLSSNFYRIKDVSWQGPNITVFNQVTITPPYKLENIEGEPESKAFLHIRKVVSINESLIL